jgi:hypothetical protein
LYAGGDFLIPPLPPFVRGTAEGSGTLNGRITISAGPLNNLNVNGSLGVYGNFKFGLKGGLLDGPFRIYVEGGGDLFGGGKFFPKPKGDWNFYVYANFTVEYNFVWWSKSYKWQWRYGGSIPL